MVKKVALACGYISQNIGNAFFELGASALLERAIGRENIAYIQDLPANWTLWSKARGNQRTWWNIIERLEVDAFIFQGPTLTENFESIWDGFLAGLKRVGVEPVMLSIGFSRYSSEEQRQALRLIDRHGIRTVFTRDHRSFEMLAPVEPTYSGIDSSFFVPWAYQPPRIKGDAYVASCFEASREPTAVIEALIENGGHIVTERSQMGTPDRVASRGHSAAYLSHLFRRGSRAGSIAGRQIVRPVHRTNPALQLRMFKDMNAIASDEPFTYLTIYANSEFTITDRVHAAVATLAYGGRAVLLAETPRRSLLERVGITFPMTGLQSLKADKIEEERTNELAALRVALSR